MAFTSRKKVRRNMSITSSESEYAHRTSPDCAAAGGGEWESVGREDSVGGEVERNSDFEVLQEGYLNMSVRVEEEGDDRSGTMARTLRSLRSTGSFSRSWKKRWCVLCRTQEDGVSIFYYNKKSSYTNLDVPIGIFFMEESRKIFTVPGHPKSRCVFAIDFPYRTVHMYPEKEQQLTDWLDILKTSLRLTEHSSPSPSTSPSPPLLSSRSSHSLPLCLSLRAPKQKALKRDCRNGRIDEEEPSIVLTRAIVTKQDCTDSRIARQPVSGSDPANGEINYLTLAS